MGKPDDVSLFSAELLFQTKMGLLLILHPWTCEQDMSMLISGCCHYGMFTEAPYAADVSLPCGLSKAD